MGIEKIREYLEQHGLTQKDLAFKCKLTPQSISAAMKRGKIGAQMADKMDMHTKGKLKYEELTEEPRPKKAYRRKAFKQKEGN